MDSPNYFMFIFQTCFLYKKLISTQTSPPTTNPSKQRSTIFFIRKFSQEPLGQFLQFFVSYSYIWTCVQPHWAAFVCIKIYSCKHVYNVNKKSMQKKRSILILNCVHGLSDWLLITCIVHKSMFLSTPHPGPSTRLPTACPWKD